MPTQGRGSGPVVRDKETAAPVGDGEYVVQQGECMASIAFKHGFKWEILWNHPGNATLKPAGRDPGVLLPQDRVHIPERRPRIETRETDKLHEFVRLGVPEKLRIVLLDTDGEPRAYIPYALNVEGELTSGKTDSQGILESNIAPDANNGLLIVFGRMGRNDIPSISVSLIPPLLLQESKLG
jgi:hypothetical protein